MNILIVGDLMIDRYWYCTLAGISPEAPIPLLKYEQTENKLGGAGNVALNVQVIAEEVDSSIDVAYGSCVSFDVPPELQQIRCFSNSPPTVIEPTIKNRLVIRSPFQTIARWDQDVYWDKETALSFSKDLSLKYRDFYIGLISDYGLGAITKATVEAVRATCDFVIVDPKGNDLEKYRGLVDIITPNIAEINILVPNTRLSLKEKAAELSDELRTTVILKLGKDGVFIVERGNGSFSIEGYHKGLSTVDPIGAGDTFISALSVALAKGKGLRKSAEFAVRLAGISVTEPGCYKPTPSDIAEAFSEER